MTKYKRTYFRINTPSYYNNKYGVGFGCQQEREDFDNHIVEMFLNDGWELKEKRSSNSCPEVIKDKQTLYLHPQHFSGAILEENISHIEKLLSSSTLFKFKKTDIYEDVFDLSDDEYIELLKSKQDEIEKDILEAFKTKRRNL